MEAGLMEEIMAVVLMKLFYAASKSWIV